MYVESSQQYELQKILLLFFAVWNSVLYFLLLAVSSMVMETKGMAILRRLDETCPIIASEKVTWSRAI